MASRKDLEDMDSEELKAELDWINDELADMEMEQAMLMRQTGVHVNAITFRTQQDEMDREISRLGERLKKIEELIDRLETGETG